jgi:hypothetical protein
MRTINKKYRRIVSQVLLAFYLTVSVGFVFHHHHINLSAESIVLSQNSSTKDSPLSGSSHNGFVCIIHSNFQSLHTAFQTQIFGCFSSLPFPVLNFVENFSTGIEQLQHATANPLRAPPSVS